YLAAARRFYGDELDAAESGFSGLAASSAPWIKEAAIYMIGRVRLNEAQFNAFKDYGQIDRDGMDKAKLAQARSDLEAYIAAFPTGRYVNSARGLFRRADWLAGDSGGFIKDFAAALAGFEAKKPDEADVLALLDEIDRKYLAEDDSPL